MIEIYDIIKGIYNNEDLRKTCIPLFIGNPGIAKSVQIQQFADEIEVKLVKFIGSTKNPTEISGISMPDKDTKLMTYFDYDTLLNLKDGDIIFFDEILNTNPMVLNACLTLLEDRQMASGKKLPNVMIVAAANKQGATILTPQQKERFIFYDVAFNEKGWGKIMYEKYNLVDEVLVDLITLIKNETFDSSRFNYFSSRSIDKAINMIIKEVFTPYENKLKPILEKTILNNSEETIKIGELEWLPNEKISWLKFAKEMYKLKKNDKVNTES